MSEKKNVLLLEDITMQFGGVVAVNNLSMEVNQGEIVALIGPNGAGKTTAFNCITGVYQPTNGRVKFNGETLICSHPTGNVKYLGSSAVDTRRERETTGKKSKQYLGINGDKYLKEKIVYPSPDYVTSLGIARTFQNIRLWQSMTVFDNVLTAKHMHCNQSVFSATFRTSRKEEERIRQETLDLLKEQNLDIYKDDIASSLPYGIQRRLEIARALATEPKLLLLDEPAAGMNPQETLELCAFIKEIRDTHNLTVLMIEHHMDLVMNISDRIYVIEFGKLIAEGTPHEVQNDPKVIEAYLGVEDDE